MTKFYVDTGGNYIGGFDGAAPPAKAIEVPFPPDHALDVWDGTKYVPHPPTAEEQREEDRRQATIQLRANMAKPLTAQDLFDLNII